MQSRHSLLLSLVGAMLFVCAAPVIAHASQQDAAPPPPQSQPQVDQPAAPLARQQPPDAAMTRDAYRLTYTLTEIDGSRKVCTQHYTLALDTGAGRAHTLMETRVPVHLKVGGSDHDTTERIGIIFDSVLRKFQNGIELRWSVMQTSLADNQQKGGQGASEPPPVAREIDLASTVLMQPDQPLILWKSDIPGSTHTLEVRAELTRIQ